MTTPTQLRKLIAERLRALMASRPDLDTQVKLANRAGLSQSTINRILSADSSATADSIAQLARAFSKPPAYLLMDDPVQLALLEAVQSLKPDARQRLLGYAAGMGTEPEVIPPAQRFSHDSSVPVPPSRRAAHAKAVARPIKAPPTQETRPSHASKRPSSR